MADDDGAPDGEVPAGTLVRDIPIVNQRGLHARAAARLVQTVEKFDAEVSVSRCGEMVGGTSIMGILMLSAGVGSSIRVAAKGREAAAVLDAIAQLCADKFGEGE
ncbi:MAG TPA: HPr family phosphocarrier protein [Xanthobacteraceae bacterium]|jgi:phosphocarrier protein